MSYLEPPDPQPHDPRCPMACDYGTSTDEWGPCPFHRDHDCECAKLAEAQVEHEADALWEARARAWVKNNG